MELSETSSLPWWKTAIGYQIYPRSFQDSNNDGIGDIKGIINHLTYLKWLGIDFIWINPIYKSPNIDNGYDISDFQDISEDYGTIEDFKRLLDEAHKLNIRVIMDLVVNHTSDQHHWFKEARKSKDNPYHNFYIWQDNINDTRPNDWENFTNDPVWELNEATNEWYFHLFSPQQPDLNWENPKVQHKIIDMINWWADQNIDGFRLDALSHLKKSDFGVSQPTGNNKFSIFSNNQGIDEYLDLLHQTFVKRNLMTVGEAGGVHSDTARFWTGPVGFIDMIFELEHQIRQSTTPPRAERESFLTILANWQEALNKQGWLGLYIENHDQPRAITVYGANTQAAGKVLATLLLTLRGTPFIYQGQELGMTNMHFPSPEDINDVATQNTYERLVLTGLSEKDALTEATSWSRDNARTPMQWSKFGFSQSNETKKKSWILTNTNSASINLHDELLDDQSILHFYRQLIHLRRHDAALQTGDFKLIRTEIKNVLIFIRQITDQKRLIMINLDDKPLSIVLPASIFLETWWPIMCSSGPFTEITPKMTLFPYQAMIWKN
ncbi:glycoside hydrolase family 13 protein [Leuconostoc gelidum]|uniref:glycoside hydrolase family 13 protein n=1 Tax=Leuconostoc gelidum TaxID=1244 RepID=UPI001C7CA058|nr:alpha-glucosidase [Leuconostoc gelidum]MBZ6011013.1 alpha-glucosidase [Leuconostoc gelidum subsp. aenigmaticum]